ncbi:FAD-binding domain-containing protein [Sediminicoccus sp. KRV36]|uniref:FAD-binding domain-containing protein n=1 Tax=Sediminicoccus sp. KRV36 TaxID=3133721 RepID=UPI00200CEEDF|nr:FAD-binding domain-containing protein [Sediminicoccus rosea]UPY34859.1 deoxyribodipyrimidine photolyase [Sediminicoccus rosea]
MIVAPNRAAALARLAEFAPHMGRDYAQGRNSDGGPGARCVSALSAHLRHRLITESEVIGTALARHGAAAAEKFIQEVFWRSYWKGSLELRPQMWRDYRRAVELAPQPRALRTAMAGETGIACFDAWVRELTETGWLHNHARMWFASIWIFTLRLPWALGAEFFLQHLADADAASNTLSWRWVAGIQTPGKHYLARAENIARFTHGRFDPRGQLNETAAPLDEAPPPAAGRLPLADPSPGGRVGLLLHEDDLGFWPEGCEVVAVGALVSPAERSSFGLGQVARAFTAGAITDALDRAGARIGQAPSRVALEGVARWARSGGLTRLVTPWAPVGWGRAALEDAAALCAAEGITLHRLRRPWDEACWPLAQRGFFPFKAQIPRLIAELQPLPP